MDFKNRKIYKSNFKTTYRLESKDYYLANSKEEIGFLPGDLREKMDPWIQPIYQNMYALYDKEKVEAFITDGKIEIVPLAFMRGRTFLDSCIIVDEAQNVTHEQMEMIATRIGLRSKMIVCGDDHQVDLKSKRESGFRFLYTAAKRIKNMCVVTLNPLGLASL